MNRVEKILNEHRNTQRVKENRRVLWQVKNADSKGLGRVCNISASGMMMETNSNFVPKDGYVFSFDSDLGQENFIPQNGRLVWHKKRDFVKNGYFCGIEFVEPAQYVRSKLKQRVQKRIVQSKKIRALEIAANGLLYTIMLALTGYIIWTGNIIYQDMEIANQQLQVAIADQAALTRDFNQRYQATEIQLSQVNQELDSANLMLTEVNQELASAQSLLQETESMLAQSQEEGLQFKEEVQSITRLKNEEIAKLNVAVSVLEEQKIRLTNEINVLQDQVQYYEGGVQSIEEGRVLLNTYKDRIKLVKNKIKGFKYEAAQARAVAQEERDKIKLLLGNNGYFTKNGETVVVDMESYSSVDIKSSSVDNRSSGGRVQIDVNFVD